MIPDTVPCRCGAPVRLRGGRQLSRGRARGGDWIERVYWWAGGRCATCGFIVQYGHAGERGDYQFCREWYIDKEAGVFHRGVARRWPADWGM